MNLYLIPFMIQVIVSGFYYMLAEKHRRNPIVVALLGFGVGAVTYSLLAATMFFTNVPRFFRVELGISGFSITLLIHMVTFAAVFFVYKRLEKHYKKHPRAIETPDVLD